MSVLTDITAPKGVVEEVGFYRRLTSAFGSDDTLPGKGLDIGTAHDVGGADVQALAGQGVVGSERAGEAAVEPDFFDDALGGGDVSEDAHGGERGWGADWLRKKHFF